MNLDKLLKDLHDERERVKTLIASLEDLAAFKTDHRKGRGRKSMGTEERRAVSARMKLYWAGRKPGEIKTETDPFDSFSGVKG